MLKERNKIFHNPSWLEIGGSRNMTLVLIHEIYEPYQAEWPQCKIDSGDLEMCELWSSGVSGLSVRYLLKFLAVLSDL